MRGGGKSYFLTTEPTFKNLIFKEVRFWRVCESEVVTKAFRVSEPLQVVPGSSMRLVPGLLVLLAEPVMNSLVLYIKRTTA